MFLLFWAWLARRLRTPAEIEYRRQRGHPWLFIIALGTCVTAFASGAIVVGMIMGGIAWLLLVR